MDQQTYQRTLLVYGQLLLAVLSARLVLLIALVLTFSLFAWAMALPTYERIGAATLFALLVFLPSVRLDARQSSDRKVITPQAKDDSP
jgi:hypothetical protein